VQRHLAPALQPWGMTNAQPPPLGPTFWGTQKYIEFVAFSGHPEALSQLVRSLDCHPCPWCREPTNTPTCAFCGMTQQQTQQQTQQPAAPPPATPPVGPQGPPPAGPPQVPAPHPGDVRVASSPPRRAENGSGRTHIPNATSTGPPTSTNGEIERVPFGQPTRHE
jgi:hypothetical protein